MSATLRASRKPARAVVCIVALIAAGLIPAAGRAQDPVEDESTSPPVRFDDESHLLDFCHGGFPHGGAAWFDYDSDGDLDLFLTNGQPMPTALFENQGDGTFTDVAAEAGVQSRLGHSGVVAADLDNDGFPEIILTGDDSYGDNSGPFVLYHNQGNGTFVDITAQSGIPETLLIVVQPGRCTRGGGCGDPVLQRQTTAGAAIADIDNDGFLDIFITAPGTLDSKRQHPNRLYRNNGDLTFTEISASAGVDTALGACAAMFTDYNSDGLMDLVVANCNDVFFALTPFELFRNNGDLTFTDVRMDTGVDLGGFWMGLAPGDFDNNGHIDFFATNLGENLSHGLLMNDGGGVFKDTAVEAGIAFLEFGWGCTAGDFDNDCYEDIFYS